MQKQSDKRQVLWEENSNRTSAGSIRRESSVVQIFDLKCDKVKFAEMWMGQGSFSKSTRDCGSGVVVVGAEHNPRSRSLSQKEFPDAEIFEDNSEVTAQVLSSAGAGGTRRAGVRPAAWRVPRVPDLYRCALPSD